jgi:hypothetical protein
MFKLIALSGLTMMMSCGFTLPKGVNRVHESEANQPIKLKSVGICSDSDAYLGLVAPSCTTTRSISHLLESGSVAFGTLTAYCAVAPEPTVSKFTMAALAVGTGATQLLKFVIDNIPCEQGGQSLSPEQRLEVETMICNQAGGKLVAGECFKPE